MNQNDLNEINILMGKIATIAMIIPIILSILNYNYLNKALKIIFWFCLARIIVSLINVLIIWATGNYKSFFMPILNKLNIHDMNFIAILSVLSNFGLLGWYFYKVIENRKIASLVKVTSLFLFITAIINYLFIEGYSHQSVYNSTTSSIFCFLLPVVDLWFVYKQDNKVPIVKNPYLWVNLGLFVPNLLIFIFAIVGKKLSQTDLSSYRILDIASSGVQIIGYLFIATAFYYARYTKYLPQQTT